MSRERLTLGPTPAMTRQIEQAYRAQLNMRVVLEIADFTGLPDENGKIDCYLRPCAGPFSSGDPYEQDMPLDELPDFVADLNACAELEGELVKAGQGEAYSAALSQIAGGSLLGLVTASAVSRCEAMLICCGSQRKVLG
jgi:hypothetical protein